MISQATACLVDGCCVLFAGLGSASVIFPEKFEIENTECLRAFARIEPWAFWVFSRFCFTLFDSWFVLCSWELPKLVIFSAFVVDCGPPLPAAVDGISDCTIEGRLMLVCSYCLKVAAPILFEKMPVPITCPTLAIPPLWKSSVLYCVFGCPSTFMSFPSRSICSRFLYFLKLEWVFNSPCTPLFYFSSVLLMIESCLFLADDWFWSIMSIFSAIELFVWARSRSFSFVRKCEAWRFRGFSWECSVLYYVICEGVFGCGENSISLPTIWLSPVFEAMLILTWSIVLCPAAWYWAIRPRTEEVYLAACVIACPTVCFARVCCPYCDKFPYALSEFDGKTLLNWYRF